ncbi:MAG: sigma-70 family RNA polymerase sigma factor, partial [Pseudomonadota bacterium]|nr:sigma-70 family RNA polymerase sigma factor [Pseudomonadota bacterium]
MGQREVDHGLVERVQQGDKKAFGLLVEKYQHKLGRLISRFIPDASEIEDITQETFIRAYRALSTFRNESAFYTWLYRIGINTAKNYLAARNRRAPTVTEFDAEDAEGFESGNLLRSYSTPETELMSKQVMQTVNAA